LDGPGEHPHEAGLAVAVAADDADPVPFVDAEGDRVQDDARGVLQVQRLCTDERERHQSRAAGRTCAPWTGPVARMTSAATPEAVSEMARSMAPSAVAARTATVGPEPETKAASAPKPIAASMTSPMAGCRAMASGWRSLSSTGASSLASPLRRALIRAALGWGSGTSTPSLRLSKARYTAGVDSPSPALGTKTQW